MKKKLICPLCKQEITESEVPDTHHKDGDHSNNKKNNLVKVHHKCHMIHHEIYPENYNELRQKVETAIDYQKARIGFENQMSARERLGFKSFEEQDELSKLMKKLESKIKKDYSNTVEDIPICKDWLLNLEGIGLDISAQIIALIGDISKFENISKLWYYSGYGLDKKGKRTCMWKGYTHNYNPNLKSVLYKLGANGFIMHKKNSYYGKLYDIFKEDYKCKHPKEIDNPKYDAKKKRGYKKCYTPKHIDMMSRRKVLKVFLKDLWIVWRYYENLPITMPYEVDTLGHHIHSIPNFGNPLEILENDNNWKKENNTWIYIGKDN